MRAYLDESGSTSATAAVVLVECSDFVMDYILKHFTKPKKLPPSIEEVFEKSNGEYKFSNLLSAYYQTNKPEIKEFLVRKLGQLAGLNVKIYYSTYKTEAGQQRQQSEAAWLTHIYAHARHEELLRSDARIIADKGFYSASDLVVRLQRIHENKVVSVVRRQYLPPRLSPVCKDIAVEVMGSSSEKGLQAADFIAGAIRQKEANNNEEYYSILRDNIVCRRSGMVGGDYQWFPFGRRYFFDFKKPPKNIRFLKSP
jgi:hypothetical protein